MHANSVRAGQSRRVARPALPSRPISTAWPMSGAPRRRPRPTRKPNRSRRSRVRHSRSRPSSRSRRPSSRKISRPGRRARRRCPSAAMQAHAQAPVIPVVAQREPVYALDTGDKLRIVVFGQEGLSNSYFVDAAGQVTIPLIGAVTARGLTTQALARAVAAKLRAGFIREPHVAIEVETYRPFFILGEVTQPGQYPYVPNMTVETAVAIAGGFTPRAYRYDVKRRPADARGHRARPQLGAAAHARAARRHHRHQGTLVLRERIANVGWVRREARNPPRTRGTSAGELRFAQPTYSLFAISDASSGSRRSAATPPSPMLRGSCRARRSGSRARRPHRRRFRCRRCAST